MRKANKKRNPVARQLKHFSKKIIKSKKLYDRKKLQNDRQNFIHIFWLARYIFRTFRQSIFSKTKKKKKEMQRL